MPQFTVDEDLAALVEKLAKPKPFENLSFNAALKRIVQSYISALERLDAMEKGDKDEKVDELDQLLAESMAMAAKNSGFKKAPSPSPVEWVAMVPELKSHKGLNTWKSICNALKIDTAGDSARRKLKNWVKANQPTWAAVPDID